MSPLSIVFVTCALLAGACWLVSLATREYSWVDRIWSVAPVFYVACFAWDRGWGHPRLNLMAALTAAWGVRLTFNYARKGGYAPGGEDYRWGELRRRMSPLRFQLLNFAFIAGYQNLLLALLSLPAWAVHRRPMNPLGPWDLTAAALFVLFLAGETVADEQQWKFQKAKQLRGGTGEQFLTSGLFRFSRHPNFFCEQGIWWSLYLFGVVAGAPWINVSIVGPLLLTILFHGSTRFTEEISLSKYSAYADYQKTTSRLLPWVPRS